MSFVVDEVLLEQVFAKILRFSLVTIIPLTIIYLSPKINRITSEYLTINLLIVQHIFNFSVHSGPLPHPILSVESNPISVRSFLILSFHCLILEFYALSFTPSFPTIFPIHLDFLNFMFIVTAGKDKQTLIFW